VPSGDDDNGHVRTDALGFLVEVWRGLDDVVRTGNAEAMRAHAPTLATLASARLL
jgi:hypothetical protein